MQFIISRYDDSDNDTDNGPASTKILFFSKTIYLISPKSYNVLRQIFAGCDKSTPRCCDAQYSLENLIID